MNAIKSHFSSFITSIGVFFFPLVLLAASAWPADSGTIITNATALGATYEPSGAYWDAEESLLYIVSDNGKMSTLDANGASLYTTTVSTNFDLEGITKIEAGSEIVYLGLERDFSNGNKDSVVAYNTTTNSVVQKWDVSSLFTGDENSGMEALTFIPNGEHPFADHSSGGVFVGGRQSDGALIYFTVDLSGTAVTHLATLPSSFGYTDVAGLEYNSDTEKLFAVYDGSNRMVIMDADGSNPIAYTMHASAHDEEGIAIASTCADKSASLFFAFDTNAGIAEVARYDNYAITCKAAPEENSSETPSEEAETEICTPCNAPPEATQPDTASIANEKTISKSVTEKRIVTSNGCAFIISRSDHEITRKKFCRKKKISARTLKIFDWKNYRGKTIVLAGRNGKKEYVVTARLKKNDAIVHLDIKKARVKNTSKKIRMTQKKHGNIMVKFGKKQTNWHITRSHQLKRR